MCCLMLDSNETEQVDCFMSFTFSNFMLGLRVLYRARPIKLIQVFQQPLLFSHGFSVHKIPTTNNAAPTVSASIACLCCVTFVDGFPAAALTDRLSRHGFISVEWSLSEAFGCCYVEVF